MATAIDILTHHAARLVLIWVITEEPERVIQTLLHTFPKIGNATTKKVFEWSLTSNEGLPGWRDLTPNNKTKNLLDNDQSPIAHQAIKDFTQKVIQEAGQEIEIAALALFKNPQFILESQERPYFIQTLRDSALGLVGSESSIILISNDSNIPEELNGICQRLELSLPDENEIKVHLEQEAADCGLTIDNLEEAIDACKGLLAIEISNAVALFKAKTGAEVLDINFLNQQKVKSINQIQGLTLENPSTTLKEVGGLDLLKKWARERKNGFSKKARDFKLPFPKGILLLGIQGTGKSLAAKAIASEFNVPLIRLNPHDIKGGIVGETERNQRKALATIDSIGRCVVWIDELEKYITRSPGQNLDGGTSDSILNSLLYWLQERQGKAFLLATSNNISALPPELTRAGRFDTTFFVDLPNQLERIEIFKIHLAKIERSLTNEEIHYLAEISNGYSGAEIEVAIISGLWAAFSGNERSLTKEDIENAIKEIIPLSVTMKNEVEELQEWAKTRARPASSKLVVPPLNIKNLAKKKIQKLEVGE